MAPPAGQRVPGRKELENMKRVDLQRLCKDYGVRANLRSEELIDLLLETRKPNARTAQPIQRSVSTRRTSRVVAPRMSSMIIHDEGGSPSPGPSNTNSEDVPSPPRTRASKSYVTQTRLGVGRPTAAGGKGARAVTKSTSLSKRRGKGSTTLQAKDTIVEEPEPEAEHESSMEDIPPDDDVEGSSPRVGPSRLTKPETPPDSRSSSTSIDERIARALAPIQRQLQSLKSDLEQFNFLKSDYERVKGELASFGDLRGEVSSLTAELNGLRQQLISTRRTPELETSSMPSLLGKRQRDSFGSDASMVEGGDDDMNSSQEISEPTRKRPRLGPIIDTETGFPKTPPNHPQSLPTLHEGGIDTPPPVDRLPDYYGTPPSQTRKRDDRQPNPIGNGHPFNFTFTVPVPRTPNPGFTMPFAYPEPPQSPTPGGHNNRARTLGGGTLRSDIFQALRRSSQEHSSESAGESSQALGPFLDQSALVSDSETPGNTILSGMGESDGETSKRTMYGTEMESDNRFGDFGFESVNPSFWAPKF